ncbi:hypothetical protein M501DRAFT_828894 [Patellaria atrata CBS 101060]|uniref:Uncharacterized protein n=1 Tax=Patellaria atrata CBS 101060 TaxID=1346257 RepID=A0A9P4SBH8_9PEZI|nr:hypothetical protein M501DRAFT_828894 [Patellaria atrata CBS 101060]
MPYISTSQLHTLKNEAEAITTQYKSLQRSHRVLSDHLRESLDQRDEMIRLFWQQQQKLSHATGGARPSTPIPNRTTMQSTTVPGDEWLRGNWLSTKDVRVWLGEAEALFQSNMHQGSLIALDRLLNRDDVPSEIRVEAKLFKSVVLRDLGLVERAKNTVLEALKRMGQYEGLYYLRGKAHFHLGICTYESSDFEEAGRWLAYATGTRGHETECEFWKILAEVKAGKMKEVEEVAEVVGENNGGDLSLQRLRRASESSEDTKNTEDTENTLVPDDSEPVELQNIPVAHPNETSQPDKEAPSPALTPEVDVDILRQYNAMRFTPCADVDSGSWSYKTPHTSSSETNEASSVENNGSSPVSAPTSSLGRGMLRLYRAKDGSVIPSEEYEDSVSSGGDTWNEGASSIDESEVNTTTRESDINFADAVSKDTVTTALDKKQSPKKWGARLMKLEFFDSFSGFGVVGFGIGFKFFWK